MDINGVLTLGDAEEESYVSYQRCSSITAFAHRAIRIGGKALPHAALPLICVVGSQIRPVHDTPGNRPSR
jgi:hypothetical protein